MNSDHECRYPNNMAGCPELQVARACSVAGAKEALLVKRLIYKNKSQHRRDRNFQKLQKLSKGLTRLQEVHVWEVLRRASWSRSRGGECWQNCKRELTEVHACLQQMVELCAECFIGCRQQMELGFFVPINLVVSASVSRVKLLLDLQRLCVERALHSTAAGDVLPELANVVGPGQREDIGEPVMLSAEEISRREKECETGYGLHARQVNLHHRRHLFVKLLVPTSKGYLVVKSRHLKGLSTLIALSTHTKSRFTRPKQALNRGTKWTTVLQLSNTNVAGTNQNIHSCVRVYVCSLPSVAPSCSSNLQ